MGPYPVLPLHAWVELGAMAMKRCSTFYKASASLEPHHQIVKYHIRTPDREPYLSAEVQSVYSTPPSNWTKTHLEIPFNCEQKKKALSHLKMVLPTNFSLTNYIYIYIYIYIYMFVYVCVCLGFVLFLGISTIVGYLIPDPLYTYILNIYDLV